MTNFSITQNYLDSIICSKCGAKFAKEAWLRSEWEKVQGTMTRVAFRQKLINEGNFSATQQRLNQILSHKH